MPTNDEIFSFINKYIYIYIIIAFFINGCVSIYKDIKKRKIGNLTVSYIFFAMFFLLTYGVEKFFSFIFNSPFYESMIIILLLVYCAYEIVFFTNFLIKRVKRKQSL